MSLGSVYSAFLQQLASTSTKWYGQNVALLLLCLLHRLSAAVRYVGAVSTVGTVADILKYMKNRVRIFNYYKMVCIETYI